MFLAAARMPPLFSHHFLTIPQQGMEYERQAKPKRDFLHALLKWDATV